MGKRNSTAVKQPDFSLLTQNIEKKILHDNQQEKVEAILKNTDYLNQLSAELLLKWSELARMNCSIAAAEKIYNIIHSKFPEYKEAYESHIEMLSILQEKEKLIKIYSTAKRNNITINTLLPDDTNEYDELQKSFYPLENLRKNQELIEYFTFLFSGRKNVFARQWVKQESGKHGYIPVRKKIDEEDIEDHLAGKETLGIYIIKRDNTCSLAVIDADVNKNIRKSPINKKTNNEIKKEALWMINRIKELSAGYNLHPLVEFSGAKGYHFWFFLKDSPKAELVKRFFEVLVSQIKNDLQYFDLEIFPKQSQLTGKGLGNLVKLPLGIHKKTGKRSFFTECKIKEQQSQLNFLKNFKQEKLDFGNQNNHLQNAEVKILPIKKNASSIIKIKNLCPPIGQIISQCLNRKNISKSEEKILYQTIGFLADGKNMLHKIFQKTPGYNHNLVNLYITRLKGLPLGCKRIHNLTGYTGNFCFFEKTGKYDTPLLHLGIPPEKFSGRSQKQESFQQALENLKAAITIIEGYMN